MLITYSEGIKFFALMSMTLLSPKQDSITHHSSKAIVKLVCVFTVGCFWILTLNNYLEFFYEVDNPVLPNFEHLR